jgi:hypothetical protein
VNDEFRIHTSKFIIHVEEEQAAREDAVARQLGLLRAKLPVLLRRLAKIKDPRNYRLST